MPKLPKTPAKKKVRKTASTKRGRPSKISRAKVAAIVEGIEKGLPIGLACKCAGVGERTLRTWRTRARTEVHFANVLAKLEAALAAQAGTAISKIENGKLINGDPDWRAQSWAFERRFPELSKANLSQKLVDAEIMQLFELMFEDEEATEEWAARTSRIWARVRGFAL